MSTIRGAFTARKKEKHVSETVKIEKGTKEREKLDKTRDKAEKRRRKEQSRRRKDFERELRRSQRTRTDRLKESRSSIAYLQAEVLGMVAGGGSTAGSGGCGVAGSGGGSSDGGISPRGTTGVGTATGTVPPATSSKEKRNKEKGDKIDKGVFEVGVPLRISSPRNFVRGLHIDQELHWMGEGNADAADMFELVEKLGEGAFGGVYRGVHRKSGMEVAIKSVLLGEGACAEIENEMDILKKCRHPNVVSYYGCVPLVDRIWILMDLCSMGSLQDIMRVLPGGALTETQIAAVLMPVLNGLAYLHSQGIMHRDIKAGNILMNERGDPQIADFGISLECTGSMRESRTIMGTPLFMAPEVVEGQPHAEKADIWSLGITMIELADGYPPHYGLPPLRVMYIISKDPPPSGPKDASKWSVEFLGFVDACLRKKQLHRPSAVELMGTPFIKNAMLLNGARTRLELIEQYTVARKKQQLQEAKAAALQRRDSSVEVTNPVFNKTISSHAQSAMETRESLVDANPDKLREVPSPSGETASSDQTLDRPTVRFLTPSAAETAMRSVREVRARGDAYASMEVLHGPDSAVECEREERINAAEKELEARSSVSDADMLDEREADDDDEEEQVEPLVFDLEDDDDDDDESTDLILELQERIASLQTQLDEERAKRVQAESELKALRNQRQQASVLDFDNLIQLQRNLTKWREYTTHLHESLTMLCIGEEVGDALHGSPNVPSSHLGFASPSHSHSHSNSHSNSHSHSNSPSKETKQRRRLSLPRQLRNTLKLANWHTLTATGSSGSIGAQTPPSPNPPSVGLPPLSASNSASSTSTSPSGRASCDGPLQSSMSSGNLRASKRSSKSRRLASGQPQIEVRRRPSGGSVIPITSGRPYSDNFSPLVVMVEDSSSSPVVGSTSGTYSGGSSGESGQNSLHSSGGSQSSPRTPSSSSIPASATAIATTTTTTTSAASAYVPTAGNLGSATVASSAPPLPSSSMLPTYPYSVLRQRPSNLNLNMQKLERYLDDSEFRAVFGMNPNEFRNLSKPRRVKLKAQVGLM